MILIALDGFAVHATRPLPALAQQHLDAFAAQEDYATVTLRAADHTADYLAVRGCVGCASDTCVVGCRATLLRRALAIALPGLTTRVLRHPLVTRPAARGILAWPMRDAFPLNRSILAQAESLAVHIGIHREGSGVRTIALLAVGATDPAPTPSLVAALRDHRWRTALVPRLVQPTLVKLLHNPPRLLGTRASWGAHLLTSAGASCTPLLARNDESAPAHATGAAMGVASGREDGA